MRLTKRQINRIEAALKKAREAEGRANIARQTLCSEIVSVTGISGNVDFFNGDGFGFTPDENGDTHIGVPDLIREARKGADIDIEWICDRLVF